MPTGFAERTGLADITQPLSTPLSRACRPATGKALFLPPGSMEPFAPSAIGRLPPDCEPGDGEQTPVVFGEGTSQL